MGCNVEDYNSNLCLFTCYNNDLFELGQGTDQWDQIDGTNAATAIARMDWIFQWNSFT